MPKPEISVCCTVYNNGNRIRASLDSIIAAPHFSDKMEIVVSENYSTDNTWEILEEYAKKHKNIIAFRAKCIIGKGRALALERASGKFVTTADLDTIYYPARWESLWKCTKICKENETYINAAFMMRKTMKRIGGWNSDITGNEDTELFARAHAKYGIKLLTLPITDYENEAREGRRSLKAGRSTIGKYLHGLSIATGIITGGGLKFNEISARTPLEAAVLRALFVWIKLTGKKIYKYGDMPNTDIMWNNTELADPAKFGVSKRYWLYYVYGKPKDQLNKTVTKLMNYGYNKIFFTPLGVLMYTDKTDKKILANYIKILK